MFRANQLDADLACVLVIDVQEKLLPLIGGHERMTAAMLKLLDGVRVFGLPVVATEQYVRGLGPTVAPISTRLREAAATVLEKAAFSACGDDTVRQTLSELDRPQVILAGIEAHVCVQQTALDLRAMDYRVFVCADAIGSRGKLDYEQAIQRMRQDGVIVTTVESVLFELCNRCDTPRFKAILEVIKAHPPQEE